MNTKSKALVVSAEQAEAALAAMYGIILAAMETQRWANTAAQEQQLHRARPLEAVLLAEAA